MKPSRSIIFLLALGLASCGTISPSSGSAPSVSWMQFHGFLYPPTSMQVTQLPARVAQLRPAYGQFEISWINIEAVRNVYDFSLPDSILASNRLLTPFGALVECRFNSTDTLPKWYGALPTNEQMVAIASTVSNILNHYAGRIALIAVQCEPGINTPDLTYHTMILSSCVAECRAAGVGLIGGELNGPQPLGFPVLVALGFTNYCDWIGFHYYDHQRFAPTAIQENYLPNYSNTLAQSLASIAALGKPMICDEFGLFNTNDIATNLMYAQRATNALAIMRQNGVRVIAPYFWPYNTSHDDSCDCSGAYSNGVLTTVGEAILTYEATQ